MLANIIFAPGRLLAAGCQHPDPRGVRAVMRSNQVHIDTPCHESWDVMEGDAERRFCGVCQKHVHNLSAMTHDDATALLQATAGEHLCVRYTAEPDGALRFRDLVPQSRLTRGLRRAAFAAVLLAACSPSDAPTAAAAIGDVVIESVARNTVATPDGGCNVTTGPFTTFHFPAGHAMCSGADEAATPIAPATPPAALPVPDPFPAVTPEPTVDPIPVPRMGEAMAVPDPVEPFVPCDPQPGYAPPPPSPRFAPPPPQQFAPPPPRVAPPKPPQVRQGAIASPRTLMGDVAPPRTLMGGKRPDPDPQPDPRFAPPPEPRFAPPPPDVEPRFAPPPPSDEIMGSVSRSD